MQQQRIKISPPAWRTMKIVGTIVKWYIDGLTVLFIVSQLEPQGFWQKVTAFVFCAAAVAWTTSTVQKWVGGQYEVVPEITEPDVDESNVPNHSRLVNFREGAAQ